MGACVTNPRRRIGFSLLEVLMAIFILGIGIISIAAVFPAGIAQQRQALDDAMGPIVAENALAIIRGRVSQSDFGPAEAVQPNYVSPTIPGDWEWRRPSFYPTTVQYSVNGDSFKTTAGSISIFQPAPPFVPSNNWAPTDRAPWNVAKYGDEPPSPPIIITQGERYYPMQTEHERGFRPVPDKPQYVWDCMFRRFQGKILVAIFVYRVNLGGESVIYTVASNPNSPVPPLPIAIDLRNTPPPLEPWSNMPWYPAGDEITPEFKDRPDGRIPGTFPGNHFDPFDQRDGWQMAGQWLLDQNNNIHRVVSGRRLVTDGPVELARPVPPVPTIPLYISVDPNQNTVTDFWFIPQIDSNGVGLTSVYVTVREL